MPKGSFIKWKEDKEAQEHIEQGLSQDGAPIEDSPSLERLQESDDPAAEVDVENPEWFQDLIEYRRKDKRNTSIFVLGAPRAGKSYTALTLSEVTDAQGDFDVENHVVMHTADFVRKINEFPQGCNIMYDEGGAGHSSRRFMSKMNIMMNAVLQTFGSRYINVVWTVPNMRMEDVTARQLCTFSIRMIARGKGIIYSHWSDVHTGKPYWRRLGNYVQFGKPFDGKPKQIKIYEKMKFDYQKVMYESIARELDNMEREERDALKLKDPNFLAESIRTAGIDDFLTEKGNLNVWAVKAAFQGAPMNVIYTAKEVLKQKYGLTLKTRKVDSELVYENNVVNNPQIAVDETSEKENVIRRPKMTVPEVHSDIVPENVQEEWNHPSPTQSTEVLIPERQKRKQTKPDGYYESETSSSSEYDFS
jgi:hypothetical protein